MMGVAEVAGIGSTSSRLVSSCPCFAVDSMGGGGRGTKAGEHRSMAFVETSLRLVSSFGEAGGVGDGDCDGGREISAGESRPRSREFCNLPALRERPDSS